MHVVCLMVVEGFQSKPHVKLAPPLALLCLQTQLRMKSDSWWLAELRDNQDGRETERWMTVQYI